MIVLRYILGFLFLGGCWHAGALALGPDLLPDPVATIRLFAESLSTPEFWGHILVSLWRLTLGLVAAVAVAFPLGLLLGHCRAADLAGSPLLFITYPLPKIVLLPVFFTLVGLGDASRVLLIALTTGYQVLVIIRAGALSIDPSWVKAFRSMGGTTARGRPTSLCSCSAPRALHLPQGGERHGGRGALSGRKLRNHLGARLPHHGRLGHGGRALHVQRHSGHEPSWSRDLRRHRTAREGVLSLALCGQEVGLRQRVPIRTKHHKRRNFPPFFD